jgi:hypothetical protein
MTQRKVNQGSLFAAISEGIASQEHAARLQKLEIGLGFLGFWTLIALSYTVFGILTGQREGRAVIDDAVRRGRDVGA